MAQSKNPMKEISQMIEYNVPSITINWAELKAWQILVHDLLVNSGYRHDKAQDKDGKRTYRRTEQ